MFKKNICKIISVFVMSITSITSHSSANAMDCMKLTKFAISQVGECGKKLKRSKRMNFETKQEYAAKREAKPKRNIVEIVSDFRDTSCNLFALWSNYIICSSYYKNVLGNPGAVICDDFLRDEVLELMNINESVEQYITNRESKSLSINNKVSIENRSRPGRNFRETYFISELTERSRYCNENLLSHFRYLYESKLIKEDTYRELINV